MRLKEPPGVLGGIVARTLADLPARRACDLPARPEPIRDFAAALRTGSDAGPPALIAEFKPRSPSRGEIRPGAQVEEFAAIYAPYASAMSVLTDAPYFGGEGALLRRARAHTPVPILRKDFIVTRFQVEEAHALGADALLLMASLLTPTSLRDLLAATRDLGLEALVEVHDERELDEALEAGGLVVGVNSRDLTTLEIDLPRAHRLLEWVPRDRVVVAESGLGTRTQIEALPEGVNAVLIGTAFMSAAEPEQAIHDMGFVRCR
jgi:indole-3-glycerol phosphate synthase